MTSGLFSLLVLIVLAATYRKIAVALTDWENHKIQSDYTDALIAKQFCFDFVNTYSSLFYVGLVKSPAGKNILGKQGWNDDCSYSSCLADLMIQLLIIFVGGRIIAHLQEWIVPLLIRKYNARETRLKLEAKKKKYREHYGHAHGAHVGADNDHHHHDHDDEEDEDDPSEIPIWIKDDELDVEMDVMQQFNTMALQFGFMTLFINAFPLAPLFALINNAFEMRMDARKTLIKSQRCVPYIAQDIGSWQQILSIVSYFAVISNACIIAFSSQSFQDTYLVRLGPLHSQEQLVGQIVFVLVFEHVVFGLKFLIQLLVPDIPPQVKRAK